MPNTRQYDWRELVTATDQEARANRHRPNDQAVVCRQVLRLHRTGLQPRDLAILFGLNDDDVRLVLFGTDEPGTV
jgi:hypothetical protein